MLSVAVITRHQASATAMINLLQDHAPITRVIFEGWNEPDDQPGSELGRVLGRADYYRRRIVEELEGRRRLELDALDRIFGRRWRELERPPPSEEIPPRAWERAAASLERDPPDVILVFGTSLIPDTVTRIARVAALNVHSGLSPYYRGQNCTHFAILNDDLENIGVTVHLVRKGIDAGEILRQQRPELVAGDDEYSIEYKLHRLGFLIYGEILRRLSRGERIDPVPQPRHAGLLLMSSALTAGHTRLVRELIAGGAVERYLERHSRGKTRPKPIVAELAMSPPPLVP